MPGEQCRRQSDDAVSCSIERRAVAAGLSARQDALGRAPASSVSLKPSDHNPVLITPRRPRIRFVGRENPRSEAPPDLENRRLFPLPVLRAPTWRRGRKRHPTSTPRRRRATDPARATESSAPAPPGATGAWGPRHREPTRPRNARGACGVVRHTEPFEIGLRPTRGRNPAQGDHEERPKPLHVASSVASDPASRTPRMRVSPDPVLVGGRSWP